MTIPKTPVVFSLVTLILLVSCSKEVSPNKLVTKNGVVFLEKSSNPFTGSTTYLYEDGNILETGSFVNGYKEGVWDVYHQNGRIQGTHKYVKGVLNGPFENFWDNGQLSGNGLYLDGNYQGLVNSFDKDGTPRTKIYYLNGVRDGPYEWYWDTWGRGNLRLRGDYKDGKPNGLWEGYSPSGEIWFRGKYKEGTIVGSFEEYRDGQVHQYCCDCQTLTPLDDLYLSCDMDPYLRHTEITGEWYIHMGSNQQ